MHKFNIEKKILIVGPNGSGKTTFARKLSQRLNVTHIELDNLYWKPDWQESSTDEFRERVNNITGKDAWILDGNYAKTQDLTLFRAETVIWLDYPLYKIIFRVIRRSFKRIITKEPLWHNNRESIGKLFSKDSIVLFAITSFKRKSRRYNEMISSKKTKNINWVRIRNNKDEKEFWERIK